MFRVGTRRVRTRNRQNTPATQVRRVARARQLLVGSSMSNQRYLALFAIAGSLVLNAERADACTLPTKAVHRFWQQTGTPSNTDRCTFSLSSGWQCHLSGWLFTPSGTSGVDLPAIVYIHGSGGAF